MLFAIFIFFKILSSSILSINSLFKQSGLDWFMKHEYKNRESDKGRAILVGRLLNIPQLCIFADRRVTRYIREK